MTYKEIEEMKRVGDRCLIPTDNGEDILYETVFHTDAQPLESYILSARVGYLDADGNRSYALLMVSESDDEDDPYDLEIIDDKLIYAQMRTLERAAAIGNEDDVRIVKVLSYEEFEMLKGGGKDGELLLYVCGCGNAAAVVFNNIIPVLYGEKLYYFAMSEYGNIVFTLKNVLGFAAVDQMSDEIFSAVTDKILATVEITDLKLLYDVERPLSVSVQQGGSMKVFERLYFAPCGSPPKKYFYFRPKGATTFSLFELEELLGRNFLVHITDTEICDRVFEDHLMMWRVSNLENMKDLKKISSFSKVLKSGKVVYRTVAKFVIGGKLYCALATDDMIKKHQADVYVLRTLRGESWIYPASDDEAAAVFERMRNPAARLIK